MFISEMMQKNEDEKFVSKDKNVSLRSQATKPQTKRKMQYSKYEQLTDVERKQAAIDLLQSPRGTYIIGKALFDALTSMEARPEQEQEYSNQADIELLGEQIFELGWKVGMLDAHVKEAAEETSEGEQQ